MRATISGGTSYKVGGQQLGLEVMIPMGSRCKAPGRCLSAKPPEADDIL